jgi:hypothetical protein
MPAQREELSLQNKVLDKNKQTRILTLSAITMQPPPPTPSPAPPPPPLAPFRSLLADALRFWEPRRIIYNLALFAVAVAWLILTWPHFRPALALTPLFLLSILALLANVCYSAAYLIDIPMQHSALAAVWRHRRWLLLLAGTLFAILVECYWIADEIYPDFR